MGAVARRAKLTEEEIKKRRKEAQERRFTERSKEEWKASFKKEMLKKQELIKENIELKRALSDIVKEAKIAISGKQTSGKKLPYQSPAYRDATKKFDKLYKEAKKKAK